MSFFQLRLPCEADARSLQVAKPGEEREVLQFIRDNSRGLSQPPADRLDARLVAPRRRRARASGSRSTCCSSPARLPGPQMKTRRPERTSSVSFVWWRGGLRPVLAARAARVAGGGAGGRVYAIGLPGHGVLNRFLVDRVPTFRFCQDPAPIAEDAAPAASRRPAGREELPNRLWVDHPARLLMF